MELEGEQPTKQIATTNGNHKPKIRSWDVNKLPHIYLEGYTFSTICKVQLLLMPQGVTWP